MQEQQWPIETQLFLFFLALLLCYCITHDPAGSVYSWHSRYSSSLAVRPLLCDSHGRYRYAYYVCALVYAWVGCVLL